MNWISVVGFVGAACTTIAYLPQVIKSWKTKRTADVSLSMYLIVVIGVLLWLIYGLFIRDWPLILANGITFVLAFSVLILKLRFK